MSGNLKRANRDKRMSNEGFETGNRKTKKEEIVQVEDHLKGLIIGKGGQRIKYIKEMSGAFVKVCPEGFLVAGSEDQRECAKKSIQDIVNASQMSMAKGQSDNNDVDDQEFVQVDEKLKGHVIGKRGCKIKMIKEKSGAYVEARDAGFLVRGSQEQRECAKREIREIVKEVSQEIIFIPEEYKPVVIGSGGRTLNEISSMTGARLFCVGGSDVGMTGPEECRKRALLAVKRMVAKARMSSPGDQKMMACCFVDDMYLPNKCGLSFIPSESKIKRQYRLRLSDDDERDTNAKRKIPCYLENLKKSVTKCLLEIKKHIDSGKKQSNDMWCHFGTVLIENVDEEDAGKTWSLETASANLMLPEDNNGKPEWSAAFKEGVQFDETRCLETLQKYAYATRHDLNFLTPLMRPVRCKVWVREKDDGGDDEEIPFDDVKNVLEEVHFRDERTNARCKGWLCLPSAKRLKADIVFPACDLDCRLTIRARNEPITERQAHKEEDSLLLDYLSNLTLVDNKLDELPLPKKEIPEGFYLDHRRFSRRSLFSYGEDFKIILSKETSFRDGNRDKKTDLHLHCKKWDELLRSGKWEPQDIVEQLPGFLSFVNNVHSMILSEQGNHASTDCDDL